MSEPATREELVELFGAACTEELAAEAEERWGQTEPWRQSQERTAALTKEEWDELKAEGRQITDDFAAALRAGVPVTDARALNIAERHRRSLQCFYDCSPQLHRDIAELYVSDPRFAHTYESVQAGLAAYVRMPGYFRQIDRPRGPALDFPEETASAPMSDAVGSGRSPASLGKPAPARLAGMTILDDARPGMDLSVRPQDDLFGHVNGTWLAETEIPADRSSYGAFALLAEQAERDVRAIVEECAAVSTGPSTDRAEKGTPVQQIGDLWTSFMDEARIEELGASPIAADLEALAAVSDHAGLAAFIGALERRGGAGFFRSYVDTDDRNSDRYLVNVLQGGLGLPDESYYRDAKFAEIRTAYVAYLARMAGLAGLDPGSAEQVMALETRLAEGHWERAETRDVLKAYNLRSFAELRRLAPAFAWHEYADALGADEQTFAEVVVRQPSFFQHLSKVVEEVGIEDWKAWAAVKVVRAAAPYLASAFVETNFDFYGRTLSGTPELRARWKRGVAFVEGCVGEAVGQLYVERHFPPHSKAVMDELVANLLEAYRQSITALDWMTPATKERAFRKLETFRPKIGYPEKFRDYSAIDVRADDLWHNAKAAASFEHDRQLAKIGSPVDRDEWFMLPQTVNAYYNPGTNEICFPAGILQRPFFDADADPAENYGGIGSVIGHEIGHGFDDQGSEYDELGNLNEWWTPEDKAAFKERSDKLVEQYSALSPRDLPGEKVNGALTVGENIGDLGGLTIGHKAYLISLDGQPMPRREGLTGSQRLFLNWGYVWRSKYRKELAQQLITVDPHSPAELRANIVRNLDEFHEAFGTEPGDGLWLGAEERVRIW